MRTRTFDGDWANRIKITCDIFNTTKAHYVLDKFHVMQALQRITIYANKGEYEIDVGFIEYDIVNLLNNNSRSFLKIFQIEKKLLRKTVIIF